MSVQSVRTVIIPKLKQFEFPLKKAYDEAHRTLEGVRGDHDTTQHVFGPFVVPHVIDPEHDDDGVTPEVDAKSTQSSKGESKGIPLGEPKSQPETTSKADDITDAIGHDPTASSSGGGGAPPSPKTEGGAPPPSGGTDDKNSKIKQ